MLHIIARNVPSDIKNILYSILRLNMAYSVQFQIQLYAFKFYGISGSKTFTNETGEGPKSQNDFLSYLMDMNFYCDSIKSIFTH